MVKYREEDHHDRHGTINGTLTVWGKEWLFQPADQVGKSSSLPPRGFDVYIFQQQRSGKHLTPGVEELFELWKPQSLRFVGYQGTISCIFHASHPGNPGLTFLRSETSWRTETLTERDRRLADRGAFENSGRTIMPELQDGTSLKGYDHF
ncbi:hypothetical protein B0F90DRAFT_1668637 [Multifurca ochricompacta]|uniref:Uncharacterized protein n=1 Tax=Multifurca ochricompacta TaxID=376703 RepID=A0AAD4QKB7_9AGAM|nr:hypothetical protein B0F90DRAFT_1668637 [Multifurca ochricompacta]